MYNFESYTIDLSNCENSEELVNNVITALDMPVDKTLPVRLKLDNTKVTESQLVSIKSLITGYGFTLGLVETTDDLTGQMCFKMGIPTNSDWVKRESFEDIDRKELENTELDELREEFKAGLEENTCEEENKAEVLEEKQDDYVPNKAVELIKDDSNESVPTKQVIGVYRKADEKENEAEFKDEEVDFYATPTDEPVVVDSKQTIYVNQTLRSGQILEFDGNVVIIGDCHPGSEIRATGDITVWGVLGSIAHAGIKGNEEARIRALKMNAVQLRIANCYSRRPDGGNIPYIIKSSTFTPEEARIVDDSIVLFKMASN